MTKIHIQAEILKIGANAMRTTEPAPSQVIHLRATILMRLRSAMMPMDGLTIATINVANVTARAHAASEDISIPMPVPVNPLASRNSAANQAGRIAVVTLVSKADFPQSYMQ